MDFTCRFCLHSDGKHEFHCPVANGKTKEFEKGYKAAKGEGDPPVLDKSKLPTIEFLGDPTYNLGWAVGQMDFDGAINPLGKEDAE
jgi:hypothetical protein